jgi:pimeloyl-ACP methyl ester carboxylesterase
MPALVLLPGMDGSGHLFAPLIAALGDALRVVTVRYPTQQALDYDSLTALALRDLPDQDFILLGQSFSGPIAVTLAAARPRGLRGLALCSSFVRNPRPALAPLGALARHLPMKAAPAWLLHHYLLGRHARRPKS